jgi:hypothetical protein
VAAHAQRLELDRPERKVPGLVVVGGSRPAPRLVVGRPGIEKRLQCTLSRRVEQEIRREADLTHLAARAEETIDGTGPASPSAVIKSRIVEHVT